LTLTETRTTTRKATGNQKILAVEYWKERAEAMKTQAAR
jgi:hypothetical protein